MKPEYYTISPRSFPSPNGHIASEKFLKLKIGRGVKCTIISKISKIPTILLVLKVLFKVKGKKYRASTFFFQWKMSSLNPIKNYSGTFFLQIIIHDL